MPEEDGKMSQALGIADESDASGRQDMLTRPNLFDTAITDGYDAIFFIPLDIDAGNEPIERAKAAGIPVSGSNAMVSNTALHNAYINSNDVEAGEMLGALEAVKRGEQVMSSPQDAQGQAQGAIDLVLHKLVGHNDKPRAAVCDVNGNSPWNVR